MLGHRIKERRKNARLTQEELGLMVGVAKATICGWEKGTYKPNIDMAEDLADALNTTAAYLLGYTDDPEDYEKADELNYIPVEWIDHFEGDAEAAAKAYRAMDADRAAEANKKPSQKESLSAKDVERMLVEFGWIEPGEDLTDSDLDYLMAIGNLITLWFANRKKG